MTETKYKIIVEKEYYKLSYDKPDIALLMMVKNEKKCLQGTLDSVVGYVKALIIYDTGSTDNTLDIIQTFSEKHKINLYLIQGEFENFAISRSVVLEYAEKVDIKFLLLLDCNDILQGGDKLLQFAKEHIETENTGYLVCQHWWSGQFDKYYNVRFVKNRKGWRYRGAVHEWMKDTTSKDDQPSFPIWRMADDIVLYQDRTKDDDKTGKRFVRDRILLLKDLEETPNEPRTLFYLAQTCSCLNNKEESFYYYKIRSTLDGFWEEKFHAFLRCGNLSTELGHPWHDSLAWYMKAIEYSNRAEPLVKIAEYYRRQKKWFLSYGFASLACQLNYPDHCILFVDKLAYDYQRWHVLGIVGFYALQYDLGKQACIKAIQAGKNVELDKRNLQFYLDREEQEAKKAQDNSKTMTKKDFFNSVLPQLNRDYSNLKPSQITKKANTLWKLHTIKNKKDVKLETKPDETKPISPQPVSKKKRKKKKK